MGAVALGSVMAASARQVEGVGFVGFGEVDGKKGSVGDLKAAIDRGLPVYTRVATTSRAHVLYPVLKLCATSKKIELVGPTLASGSLGGQYSYPEPKDPALRPVAAPAPARARTPDDDAAVAGDFPVAGCKEEYLGWWQP
jgi:hypothetical protein